MVLKNSSKKGSLKAKRKAGWDNKVLAQMLDEKWNF